jgi:hypothetical protein
VFRSPLNEAQILTLSVSGSTLKDNQTGIDSIVGDGSTLSMNQLKLEGLWHPQASLLHPNTVESASVSFKAKTAVVLLSTYWHCGHLSLGTQAGEEWKDSCHRHHDDFAAVELPVVHQPRRSLFAWLAVFLAGGIVIQPWRNGRRLTCWLIVYLLVLHFLVWATQWVGIATDSSAQLESLRVNAVGWPGVWPPGYPPLVGIGYLVSAKSAGAVVTFMQHCMMVATIWWCFRLLQRCTDTPLAFVTALVMGAAAPVLFLPQEIMSETAALFAVVGTLYFAVAYRDRGRLRDAALSGALLGWAGLLRVAPLTAEAPAIFLLMIGSKGFAVGFKRAAAVVAIALLFLILPALWFQARSGWFALVICTGAQEYDRVVVQQGLLDPRAPATSRFLRLIGNTNPRTAWYELLPVLQKKGLTWTEFSPLMEDVSLEGIRMAPWRYIGYSFKQALIQFFDDPSWWLMRQWRSFVPWWSPVVPDNVKTLDSAPMLGIHARSLLWRHKLEWQFHEAWSFFPWLALAGVISSLFLRDRLVFLCLAIIVFGYALSAAFAELELPRLNLMTIPLYLCLATGPFAAVLKAFRGKTRNRADPAISSH